MKLLLVEDNNQLNKALTTLLKRNSYLVDSASDGEEALICLNNKKCHISDIFYAKSLYQRYCTCPTPNSMSCLSSRMSKFICHTN